MNALTNTTKTGGAMAAYTAGRRFNDELSAGVQGGFAVVTYKGKEWNVKYQGVKTLITRNDVHGDGSKDPAASLEVVIVKSSPVITKTWYEKPWADDGSNSSPDCFSSNGITPDAASPKKQNTTCKTCKWDAFGSRAGEGKGKACQDSRRIAIVPSNDLDNEAFGGPMLLRVPPASLKELVKHATKLDQQGFQYFGVVSRISFTSDSYPHLVFGPARVLSDDEDIRVIALRESSQTARVLSETPVEANAAPSPSTAAQAAEEDPYANLKKPTAAAPVISEITPAPVDVQGSPAPAVEVDEDDEDEKAAQKLLEEARAKKAAKAAAKAQPEAAAKVVKLEKKDEAPKPTVAVPASFDAILDGLA